VTLLCCGVVPLQAVLACDVERTELLAEEASIQAKLSNKVR
jgi:hypothetical protein